MRACSLLAIAMLFVPAPALAAWSHDPDTNSFLAPTGVFQNAPSMDTDGAGGFYVAWHDLRAGNLDIYVQHIGADGNVVIGWPVTGLAVCAVGGSQAYPSLVTDGAGGCWIAWEDARISNLDRDIYIEHVLPNATLSPTIPVGGLKLSSTAGKDEATVHLAADGLGGAYAVWTLVYAAGTDYDVYGAHVNAADALTFAFAIDGAFNLQMNPAIVVDGASNADVAYLNDDHLNVAGAYEIRVKKINASGGTIWGPVAITNPVPVQGYTPAMAPDLLGGAYIVYTMNTGTANQLYANRVNGVGTIAWGFGSPVASLASTVIMDYPVACGDGSGGLLVAWSETYQRTGIATWGAYAARFLSTGYHPVGWPNEGLPVCSSSLRSFTGGVVPDGTGGAVVAFVDQRSTTGELWASRLNGAGARVAGWAYSGNPLATAGSAAIVPAVLPDGSGGLLACFSINRLGSQNLLVQDLDAFGQPGDNRPVLANPADVRNDQGGKVRLAWNASWLDQPASLGIAQYWVWRQTPVAAAQAAVQAGLGRWDGGAAAGSAAAAPAAGARLFRPAGTAGVLYAWEYLAALGTNGSAQYSYVAATTTDSMTGHNPYTTFMVEARGAAAGTFWQSSPDSGYSVDNLPPLPPAPFAGTYSAGTATLHWGVNLEADLAGYRLYRGTSASFTPSPGNLVAAKSDTGYVDVAGQAFVYKLSAVDIHGNESAFVTASPAGVLGVAPEPARVLSLSAPMPNPARGSASIAYTLSRVGPARLSLYDASGRRVRVLADGVQDAGSYRVALALHDGSRDALPAGLYWVRLEAEGRALTQRLLTLR